MNTKTSLLTALRKYRPRDLSDPMENFITEAFAWLLRNHQAFGQFYLRKITETFELPPMESSVELDWSTQTNLGGVFPDLICIVEDHLFIFEHKVWSPLHDNQLANYRAAASRLHPNLKLHLIVVAGGDLLRAQNPDGFICWRKVHEWIAEWQRSAHYEPDFLFSDFQKLLEVEGMGPLAPVSHEAILAYKPGLTLEPALVGLIQRTSHHLWGNLFPVDAVKPMLPWHRSLPAGKDPWGRIGINLMGNDHFEWSPGIFIGFLIDPTDHGVDWLNPLCPDFGVIFDVNPEKSPNYENLDAYQRMRDELAATVGSLAPGFEFLDHFATSPEPNRWHPIHIRMPMVELFRGSADSTEQDKRFIAEASRILGIISGCQAFWDFREELKQIRAAGISESE